MLVVTVALLEAVPSVAVGVVDRVEREEVELIPVVVVVAVEESELVLLWDWDWDEL